MRRRSEAVNRIIKHLQKSQLELIPDVELRKDGKVIERWKKPHAKCWFESFPILLKSLLRPQWLHPHRWQDFPCLLHVTMAEEYNGTLQQLCDFISDIQGRLSTSMNFSTVCKALSICKPPIIDIRKQVESQVRERLERPSNAVKTE